MKRILITGKNSYIGNSFKEWLAQWPEEYEVDEVSTRDNIWKEKSFAGYDSILHAAGIAHNSSDTKLEELYYKINRDLTYEIALKAKKEGVNHFVFMSSMIVYGTKNEVITKDIAPNPDNFYGDSKLQAEEKLSTLQDYSFKVAIVRPPMVYGRGAKGNYVKLAKFAKSSPIFPDYENKRSMIHIDNLCDFLKLIIQYKESGFYHPQNKEYVNTGEMIKEISKVHGNQIYPLRSLGPLINYLKRFKIINKVFGDSIYEIELSEYRFEYQVRNFKDTIKVTELKKEGSTMK